MRARKSGVSISFAGLKNCLVVGGEEKGRCRCVKLPGLEAGKKAAGVWQCQAPWALGELFFVVMVGTGGVGV